ncbi:Alkaline protease 1 [Metarhizium anisopliae]
MNISAILTLLFGLVSAHLAHTPVVLEPQINQHGSDFNKANGGLPGISSQRNQPEGSLETRNDMTLAKRNGAPKTQTSAPWGLRSISHRLPGAIYEGFPPSRNSEYYYDTNSGSGTFAYILDDGIRETHKEFEGRAKNIYSIFPEKQAGDYVHGTAVAGIIGSKTYGVAKKTTLLSVKTLGTTGADHSEVLKALLWTAEHIVNNTRQKSSVINLSFGVKKSDALNKFIELLVGRYDIPVVTAAGNEGEDAGTKTPGSAKGAINVGYINKQWGLAPRSNWGPAVTILAPGVDVETTGSESDTNAVLKSGSSYAAPYISGLVLNAISVHGVKGAANIKKFLLEKATKDRACVSKSTPNLVANNGNAMQDKVKSDDKSALSKLMCCIKGSLNKCK